MTETTTTSIRLPIDLKKDLDKAAHILHRGKNWIIVQALEAYLKKVRYSALIKEARRQSLIASKKSEEDELTLWERNHDDAEWR